MKMLFVMLMLLVSSLSIAGDRAVRIVTFEFPPIYQNTQPRGLSVEVVAAAFEAVDTETQIEFVPVQRMIQMVASGAVDGAIGGQVLFEAPEVAAQIRISDIVQLVSQVFLYDERRFPGGIVFRRLEDLEPYRIGVLEKTGIHRILEKTPSLKLEVSRTHEGLARQLLQGRIDVWATVDLTGMLHMRNLAPESALYFRYSRHFNLGDVSMVFSRLNDPQGELSDRFRKGLRLIRANGTYEEIMARYYGGREKINRDSIPVLRKG